MSTTSAHATSAQTTHQPFRAVIFDYGRVLCHEPLDAQVERIASLLGCDQQTFWKGFATHRPAYDMGTLTCKDFWQRMVNGSGVPLTSEILAQLDALDFEMWSRLEHSMIRWAASLQQSGYKTAVLSNAPLEFAQHARRNFHWLGDFEVSIFSAELRLAKPDSAIYRRCLDDLGVEPHEALFIDDVAHNVEGARAAGLTAIQFSSVPQLAAELDAIGFQPLPKTL